MCCNTNQTKQNDTEPNTYQMSISQNENLKVYRFNFRPHFANIIHKFSQIHQYDSCKDFKDAFEKWEEKHKDDITAEILYLESAGYVGDFRSKVFKSARYYFRKKNEGEMIMVDDDECPPPSFTLETKTKTKTIKKSTPRKKYTSIDYDLSTKIAEFLEENHTLKPSEGFDIFCEIHKEEIEAEIGRLEEEENGLLKIKKTFKNKHFNKKRELLQRKNV